MSLVAQNGIAQNNNPNKRINLPNYDNRFLRYGLTLGVNVSSFILNYSEDFIESRNADSLQSVVPAQSVGFSLGFISQFRLAEYFDLRVLPTFFFFENQFDYNFANAESINAIRSTTTFELPILLKYKSKRKGNFRAYVVGGISPSFDLSQAGEDEELTFVDIDKTSLNIEMGVGVDIYYPLFKFSPEIRYSRGITNVLGEREDIFSNGIDKLTANKVSLFLQFQ